MTNKTKKLFASISFVLVLSFVLGMVSLVLKPKSNTKDAGFYHPSAYSICNEPKNTIDVLFLGTSQAYCSFVPLEIWKNLGITSYLCSTPSQPLYYTEEFLCKAFETQSPSLVILETDAVFEKFDEIDIINHELGNRFSLIKYHSRWKELTAKDFTFNYDYSQRHQGKGFVYDLRQTENVYTEYMTPTNEVKVVANTSMYYLDRIVRFCEEKNVKLVLVSSLSVANWDFSKHNAIAEIAKKYNVEYLDTNLYLNEIELDWEKDWLDEGKHLNYYGALKFTNWFQQHLIGFGDFTDKRNNPDYSFWDTDASEIELEITD